MSGLQLDQDLTFSRRTWTVQRIGWGLGLLLVLLAAAGLFGRGPLAWATTEADGLRVEFERQAHSQSPATMIIHLPPETADTGEEVTVWIDRAYFDAAKLVQMTPQPLRTAISNRRVEYVVRRSGAGSVRLTLEFEMRKASIVEARLGIVGGPAVEFRQFVLP